MRKTNRAVEEGWPSAAASANLAALIQEQAFDWLDAPVQRVTGADVPMPYSKPLEQAAFPHEEHVVHAASPPSAISDGDQRDDALVSAAVSPDGHRCDDAPAVRLDGGGHGAQVAGRAGKDNLRGEPLVEIETDKANMTYDADGDGVLVEIVAQEATLPIGR